MGIPTTTLESYMQSTSQFVTNFTPYIIEERQLNARALDVFSRLMMDRIIFLRNTIDDYVANVIQAQLLFLDSVDSKRDNRFTSTARVVLFIQVWPSMTPCSISTLMWPPSVPVLPPLWLLCCSVPGTQGKRSALTHSRVMIHQPLGGMQGQTSDMEIALKETLKLKAELYNIISQHSGQGFNKVEEDSDRDYWMTAAETKDYGMVDEVLSRNPRKTA